MPKRIRRTSLPPVIGRGRCDVISGLYVSAVTAFLHKARHLTVCSVQNINTFFFVVKVAYNFVPYAAKCWVTLQITCVSL